ncbi:MAG: type II toxin-antitoxin system PemK/MazF family toxin [Verrucomicrobiota bacterium]
MNAPNPKRGQIWLVDWSPGRGSEQLGKRPALVIQTDAANSNLHYPNTIVLTVSTKGHPVPTHVEITPSPANGLSEISYVKCEQILTVSKHRLEHLYGSLSKVEMDRVETAVRKVLVL